MSADGTAVQTQGYYPWGETRFGSLETEYQYTGQFNQAALGLYYYGARWYDSYLNRWTSPDTIIPDPNNSLDYDRYSYTRNNPVRYTDPTGHMVDSGCQTEGCSSTSGAGYRDYVYNILHNGNERSKNTQYIETAEEVSEFTLSIVYEPADWAMILAECAEGNCSPLALLGFLPLVSGSKTDELVEILVTANKKTGDSFRDEIAALFEEAGYIVKVEVTKKTPFGPRRIDIEVSTSAGELLGGIETKYGQSRYIPSQRAKDTWLTLTGYIVNLVRGR